MTKKRESKHSKKDTQTQESEKSTIPGEPGKNPSPISQVLNTYRVSQPAILFVTGESESPDKVVDAFNQMLQALEMIKNPTLSVVLVGDKATTMIVGGT